jgi:hypothetical protein
MSEQQTKEKIELIRQKLSQIENEIMACKKILRGESP